MMNATSGKTVSFHLAVVKVSHIPSGKRLLSSSTAPEPDAYSRCSGAPNCQTGRKFVVFMKLLEAVVNTCNKPERLKSKYYQLCRHAA